jgi:uncharacterized protein YhbP (UPF0306 family)
MANTNLRSSALNYLQQHQVMSLATSGPGGIWAAAVFYVNHDFDIYFLSAATSRHSVNIATNSKVAVTIQEDYRDWKEIKGIQSEGHTVRLSGREQAHAVALYAKKFPLITSAPPAIAKALRKVSWYRFSPTRLYFVDNSTAFGKRDEILL